MVCLYSRLIFRKRNLVAIRQHCLFDVGLSAVAEPDNHQSFREPQKLSSVKCHNKRGDINKREPAALSSLISWGFLFSD